MKLNCKLIFTGLALLLAAIAYACMRLADSISGTSFPLLWVIIPGLLLALFGIWGPGERG